MEALIREFIPHDPSLGLFVIPDIPSKKVRNAIDDYAKKARHSEVLALYDATLLGSAKDGAVFLSDRFIFQNNDLQPAYEVRYEDIVEIEVKKKLMGGSRLLLSVNRGRATIPIEVDFSGKTKAVPYVERFLQEAMHRITDMELSTNRASSSSADQTNTRAVEEALIELVDQGFLSRDDYRKMMQVII